MNFELTEDQQAISDLAGKILRDTCSVERLREAEGDVQRGGAWLVREAWQELARAQILAAPLPEAVGGGGFGEVEACLVLEQVGRCVAPVPYLASIVMGAMPIAQLGSAEQRARLLPGALDGSQILTAALLEAGAELPPALPATLASPAGRGRWRIEGEKLHVPAAELASHALVPARTGEAAVGVFLVDLTAPGVDVERSVTTSLEPLGNLRLRGVEVAEADLLGGPEGGAAIVEWILRRAIAGLCATQAGVAAEALRLTAAHVSEREQFGHKIATFQAVAQRAADAYVDANGILLTSRQAAYRLAAGLPAEESLAIAKLWAAEAGQRVEQAAQHLHGGIGVDVTYPLHRYFRWAKRLELALGGAVHHLLRLGASLAARDPDSPAA